MTGCDHPKQDMTITPSDSMYGGAYAYCSACGGHWYMTERELTAHQQRPSKPVMLCDCGAVLETPAKYIEHCVAFPAHFTQS